MSADIILRTHDFLITKVVFNTYSVHPSASIFRMEDLEDAVKQQSARKNFMVARSK